jgi:hypothetical protein
MASELRFLNDKLLFDSDKLAMSEDCCCGCDCEAEGASPVAGFSYEQTDDDPCTLDLFDESIAGSCGSIVAWNWYKNGVLVSTDQNPTGVTYANGDDFTLEVTDSSGCTDSAVMEVVCGQPVAECCTCWDTTLPNSVNVHIEGYPNLCAFINGDYEVPLVEGSCVYRVEVPQPDPTDNIHIEVSMDIFLRVTVRPAFQINSDIFEESCFAGGDCTTRTAGPIVRSTNAFWTCDFPNLYPPPTVTVSW